MSIDGFDLKNDNSHFCSNKSMSLLLKLAIFLDLITYFSLVHIYILKVEKL